MEAKGDLKEKALLLLQRERELFELRMKHERVTIWLKLTQSLPLLFRDPGIPIADAYANLRKTLLAGLSMQRVMFVEFEGEWLRPLSPSGPPRPLAPAALSLIRNEPAGLCNDPADPAYAPLAEALGLARFIWSRVEAAKQRPLLLVAGFDHAKAKFQQPFDPADAAHLRNAAQHLEGLVGNALLVQELAGERDRLQQTNGILERRDHELRGLTEELRAANDSLEARVRERTHELGGRNRDMRLVLDNVAQGLLTIDAKGRLSDERSATVDKWFGSYEGNPSFVEYITRTNRDFASSFALGFEALIEDFLPQELCLSQLPKLLGTETQVLACSYFVLPDAAGGRGLLIVIDDVTDSLRLAQKEAEHSELLAVFQTMTRDHDAFSDFLAETDRLVTEVGRASRDETTRKRDLHTLKGNSAMIGAQVIAALCHEAENAVEMGDPSGIEAAIKRLEAHWSALKREFAILVGDRGRSMVEVPSHALEQLCEDVRRGAPLEQVVKRLTLFRFEPVDRPLARLSQYARELARRLDKGELTVVVEAGELRVDPRPYAGFWSVVVHLVRNAVDHGIEPPAERTARGKAPQGRVSLRASCAAHEWVLEVQDDGRGIDWSHVERIAAARGTPHGTRADLVGALLSDGFTTRSSVTVTSGRGVGMSAVHARVLELGGTISVRSETGYGTCWRIAFPLSSTSGVHAISEARALAASRSPDLPLVGAT